MKKEHAVYDILESVMVYSHDSIILNHIMTKRQ